MKKSHQKKLHKKQHSLKQPMKRICMTGIVIALLGQSVYCGAAESRGFTMTENYHELYSDSDEKNAVLLNEYTENSEESEIIPDTSDGAERDSKITEDGNTYDGKTYDDENAMDIDDKAAASTETEVTNSGDGTENENSPENTYTDGAQKEGTADSDDGFFGDGDGETKNSNENESDQQPENEPVMTTAPVLKKIELTEKGVHIIWEVCENAEQYRVFRKKAGSTKWSRVTTTVEAEAYDTPSAGGQNYVYTVRCVAFDGERYMSSYDTRGLGIYYVECPKILSLNNKLDGIEIKWNKVTGAQKYRVYIKGSDGKWKNIQTTTGNSFVYKNLKVGTEGTFTVRALDAKGKFVSAYYIEGRGIYRLAESTISTLRNVSKGVEITWNTQKGADGYKVYRKKEGENTYTLLETISGGTVQKYVDQTMKTSGSKYAYAIRSYHENFVSSAKPKVTCYLETPSLETVVNGKENMVTAAWNQIKSASGYEVYCKTDNDSFRQKFSGNKAIKKNIYGFAYRKTYAIYVRSYMVISGNVYYSGWSAKKEVEITKGKSVDFTNLKKTIDNITKSRGGKWSVYVKELKGGTVLSINDTAMYPASVIKLFAMASTYDQIQKGNISKNSKINTLLTNMITVSDNESFNELVRCHSASREFISGTSMVNRYLKANGYSKTGCHSTLHPSSTVSTNDGQYNSSSARDAGLLLEHIYYGECVSPEYSREMLSLLKRQTRRWKIPAGIPSGITVANKTGERNNYQHDTAIVYGPKTTFIICVFSDSTETNGIEGIKQITSAVYNYLN